MKSLLLEWIGDRREGWVFLSKRSKSGHLESITGSFRAARERGASVKRSCLTAHGTYQMEATGNVFAVSRSMGHADIKSMEPYQHPDTVKLNEAINRRNDEREERRSSLLRQDWHTNWHTPQIVQ